MSYTDLDPGLPCVYLFPRHAFLSIRKRLAQDLISPLLRIHIRAHWVLVVQGAFHEGISVFGFVEVVHLQLNLVPVGIAVVQARGGAVINCPKWFKWLAHRREVFVLLRKGCQRWVGEGDVVETRVTGILWLRRCVRGLDNGDSVMFVVIADKRQYWCRMNDVGIEEVDVEFDHFLIGLWSGA